MKTVGTLGALTAAMRRNMFVLFSNSRPREGAVRGQTPALPARPSERLPPTASTILATPGPPPRHQTQPAPAGWIRDAGSCQGVAPRRQSGRRGGPPRRHGNTRPGVLRGAAGRGGPSPAPSASRVFPGTRSCGRWLLAGALRPPSVGVSSRLQGEREANAWSLGHGEAARPHSRLQAALPPSCRLRACSSALPWGCPTALPPP
nr:translation initiation factor IF-2-like [Manis javanica]